MVNQTLLLEVPKVKTVLPVSYEGQMGSGQNHPLDMNCSQIGKGTMDRYVVKLHGDLPMKHHTCARELLGALLGFIFGLQVAEPAVVLLAPEFLKCIRDPQIKFRLQNSLGKNYGSKKETTGLQGLYVPNDSILWQKAANVFAFDALIQNSDRRVGNTNLFQKRDDYVLYDHEMAFPFSRPNALLMGRFPEAWELLDPSYLVFLRNHCHYKFIRGKLVSFDEFGDKLSCLSEDILDTIILELPEEWRTGEVQNIKDYLLRASQNAQLVKRGLQEVINA